MMQRLVKIWNQGLIKYDKAWSLQKVLVSRHMELESSQNTILLVEHLPVYTIGIRSQQYGLAEENKLKELGADFVRTNRGGLITFHGPGQLVMYPIINLKVFNMGIRQYICSLERSVIETCNYFNIMQASVSSEPNETGVWVGNSKICALGVHASRFITSHGLALNCNTDLSWYKHIVPCGLVGRDITSLSKELNKNVTVHQVIPILLNSFSKQFKCEMENYPIEDMNLIKNSLML